ncbi:MAG: RNA polymerase sigma factor RpoD/SigA [Patescibacteria group bacterium]|nr:RNA polymerase sigma factor RpoD/SigA [Patescibacteria group bacterium]
MNVKTDAYDPLRHYFDEITDSQPLSREREAELAARIAEGDERARDELAEANLLFVVSVAKQYRRRGLPFSELISAGNLGLMTAVDRFDGTRGFKFISYAVWWIRQAIQQALAEQGTVHVPMNQVSLLRQIGRIGPSLTQVLGRDPNYSEIALELDVSPGEVRDAIRSGHPVISLDGSRHGPLHEGSDGQQKDDQLLIDILPDPDTPDVDASIAEEEARRTVDTIFMCLDERERVIIRLYYGLDGEVPLTLEQIGDIMNLTRERIRQLKDRALAKLRRPEYSEALAQV